MCVSTFAPRLSVFKLSIFEHPAQGAFGLNILEHSLSLTTAEAHRFSRSKSPMLSARAFLQVLANQITLQLLQLLFCSSSQQKKTRVFIHTQTEPPCCCTDLWKQNLPAFVRTRVCVGRWEQVWHEEHMLHLRHNPTAFSLCQQGVNLSDCHRSCCCRLRLAKLSVLQHSGGK